MLTTTQELRFESPSNLSISSNDTWFHPSQLLKPMDPLDRLFELPSLKIKPGSTAELSSLAGRVQSSWLDFYDCKAAEERTPGYRSDVLAGKEALLGKRLNKLRRDIVALSQRSDLYPAERQWVIDLLPDLDELGKEFEKLSCWRARC